ncbi:MBL fold metallo-hydrolase [Cohnella endophytica]|uniref:MBL fold metallo-hydrolase n=1 Tax=Cohnella endophytica TaxID=2419778 RepID=A0A494Y0W1_9BACL|nr:MBL fold metallo-hydrolase [Cohnella endophytica]RKP55628.1 MBL fold metallo-hydrolase [Cohnella endophytica]
MLGTGSAFAKAFNNNNALLKANGRNLLVDCGITAPKALHELGYNFGEIDAVLLTHIHADHIGGMEEFAFQSKFVFGRKPILYIADTLIDTLWEHSLRGGLQQDPADTLSDYFDVRPLAADTTHELLPGLSVELMLTPHIPNKPSYSLLFNDTFFYSADMVFDPDLLHSLVHDRGVQALFHDCQLHPPGVVHASLPQLLTLPLPIQERTFLMHYGDDQPEFVGRTGAMRFVEQHRVYEWDGLTFA